MEPSAHRTPRCRRRLILPTFIALAVIIASFIAAATPAAARNPDFHHGDDWKHLWAVLNYLKQKPPTVPAVYLLGGSAAREATVNDRNWRAQLKRVAGRGIRVYNLGASSQTFLKNMGMVDKMPDVPTIVLIGINLGRFTSAKHANFGTSAADPRGSILTTYAWHRFTDGDVASVARKRAMVRDWRARRYPVFQTRYSFNRARLEDLIARCIKRGFHPVLVNLPLNNGIVRPALNKPRARYAASCRSLADKYSIPYYDFVGRVKFANRDFVDLWHCIRSGRVKYQGRLSKVIHTLVHRYGM